MENSEEMLTCTVRLLKVFYLMKGFHTSSGSQIYRRAIIQQMVIFLYLQKHNLPAWHMFKHNLAVYNEESGEISFSMLSRCVLGDTLKFDFEHLNKMYRMMNVYLQCRGAVAEDTHSRTMRSRSHQSYDLHSVEVNTTIAHFKKIINEMRSGQFRFYADRKKCFTSSIDGAKYAVRQHVDKIYKRKFRKLVREEITKMKDAFNPRFASNDPKSWPRSMNDAFDSDEDSPLKSDSEDDDEKIQDPDDDSDDDPLDKDAAGQSPARLHVNGRVRDSDDEDENVQFVQDPAVGGQMPGHHSPVLVDPNPAENQGKSDAEQEFLLDPGEDVLLIGDLEDQNDELVNVKDEGNAEDSSSGSELSEAAIARQFPDGREDPEDCNGPCAYDGLWFPIKSASKRKNSAGDFVYRVRFVGPYKDMSVAEEHIYGAEELLSTSRKRKRARYWG